MDISSALNGSAAQAARRLLGCTLERYIDGRLIRVRIVETEAYDQSDAASHSYKGATQRTKVMFGAAGHLYVYFTYGMHYCCNVVVGPEDVGAAVLIRAVEPLAGEELMAKRRKGRAGVELCNGPAKLCQALDIDMSMNGHDLKIQPLILTIQPEISAYEIIQSPRIGISQAKDIPWRFYIKGNMYVSGQKYS
ncbi:3-methyladenine DNA glycosylase [compost metagenome]